MKAALAILLLCATAHAKPTNGAFVGVGLEPHPPVCLVGDVKPDSNAALAGLEVGDPILMVDGKPMADCDEILAAIGGKAVGDPITLLIRHRGVSRTVHLEAGTREEVLRRRFVGKRFPPVAGQNADGDDVEVGVDRRAIYLFYSPGRCMGCASLASRIGARVREYVAKSGEALGASAVASGDLEGKLGKDEAARVSMPLAFINEKTYELYAFDESAPAVQAYVVDAHGRVQGVFRIGPSDDDVAARLDDLLATAAQVAHPR
ncbi:MAG TPA: PDZ domain-containing protein [Kofleriaceae bacterium]